MMNNNQPAKSEYAAGGVVFRPNPDGKGWQIAAVQRPRHDDWSLPKGHIEQGETREQAAIREVKEETGLDARILQPLGEVDYFFHKPKGDLIHKFVYHYLLEATSDGFGDPNREVAESRWVTPDEAQNLLSYERDKKILTKALVELRARFPDQDDRRPTTVE